jgi:chromosome partitioning protein
MKTLAFFNNKGGVGKTSLLYHLAHMFALREHRVVAVDLDPQANLSGMFLPDDRIESLWSAGGPATAYSAMQPLIEGTGDLMAAIANSGESESEGFPGGYEWASLGH